MCDSGDFACTIPLYRGLPAGGGGYRRLRRHSWGVRVNYHMFLVGSFAHCTDEDEIALPKFHDNGHASSDNV
jgi:hypothetical protein